MKPKICDTILDAIGETPLVRINRITKGVVKGTVYAKVETFNPGNSIKDPMRKNAIPSTPAPLMIEKVRLVPPKEPGSFSPVGAQFVKSVLVNT